jgi:hypothetical protein
MEKWIWACVVFERAAAAQNVAAKYSFFILEVLSYWINRQSQCQKL